MSTSTQAPTGAPQVQLEPRDILKWGTIAGIVGVFTAAIGMFETFQARMVINPILDLGYMSLLWAPFYLGYLVTKKPVLEGMEAPRVGANNVIAGASVGAIAGVILAGFVLLADSVNLRPFLINLTPRLPEEMGFGQPAGTGAILLLVVCTALGALGGTLQLLSPRMRSLLGAGFLWVLLAAFLELVIGSALRQGGLEAVDRWIYARSGGLTPLAAIAIFVIAIVAKVTLAGRGSNAAERYRGLPKKGQRQVMLLSGLVLLGLGALMPALFGTFVNDVLSNVGLFILLALGLNIVVGYAGLLDLGYVAFFAVGAYTTAVVTSPRSPTFTPELAFFEALPWVFLMATIAGLIIGTPVIRMRGDYLAIVTLGFGEIARIALLSDWLENVFGAAQGILRISPLPDTTQSGIRVLFGYVIAAAGIVALVIGFLRWREARRIEKALADPIPGSSLSTRGGAIAMLVGASAILVGFLNPDFLSWSIVGIDPSGMFRIVLAFVALAAFISWRLESSRLGRAWTAVREDEQIAQSMGINIVTTKLLAFVSGAILASIGGALFAVKLGTVFPHSFEILQSIIILVIVIVGGMGSIRGVIVGAVVLIGILGGPTQSGLLREFGEFKLLIYGAILVWMMLNRPEGLWPSVRRARELHQEEMLQDSWFAGDDKGTEKPAEAKGV